MNKTAPFIIQARTLKVAQDTPSGNAGQPNTSQNKPAQPNPVANPSGSGQAVATQPATGGLGSMQTGTIRADDSRRENRYRYDILPTLARMLHYSGAAEDRNVSTGLKRMFGDIFHPGVYATAYPGVNKQLQVPSVLLLPSFKSHQHAYSPEQVSKLFIARLNPASGRIAITPNVEREDEISKYVTRYNQLMGYGQSSLPNDLEAYGIENAIAHEFQRSVLYVTTSKIPNLGHLRRLNNETNDHLDNITNKTIKSDEESRFYYDKLRNILQGVKRNLFPVDFPGVSMLNATRINMLMTELNGGRKEQTHSYTILVQSIAKYSSFYSGLKDAAKRAREVSSKDPSQFEENLFRISKENLLKVAIPGPSNQTANRLLYLMITGPTDGLEPYHHESPDAFTRLRRRLAEDKDVRAALLGNENQLRPFNRYPTDLKDEELPAAYFNTAKRYLREINMLAALGQMRFLAYQALDDGSDGQLILSEFDSVVINNLSTLIEMAK